MKHLKSLSVLFSLKRKKQQQQTNQPDKQKNPFPFVQ